MKRRITLAGLALASVVPACLRSQPARTAAPETAMLMRITYGDTVVAATLENTPTARDFRSLLPLAVTLEEYAGTEKITYLPRKLSTSGAPDGVVPVAGDLAYYAPWGNLAIFYRDFRYSPGLIRLGRITSPLEALRFKGSVQARLELVNG